MSGNTKSKTVTQAVANIVQELTDFSSEERRRIVQASMTLLGEGAALPVLEQEIEVQQEGGLPAKARIWMKQHGLTSEQINQVFHPSDEGVEVIASIPGANKKEQVRNAYVLCGLSHLLASGESKFDDKSARRICELGGFFDGSNHMKYMKCSEFTGSREKGWVLTSPGLKLGASLVTQLSSV
jgi:hypothetical protein